MTRITPITFDSYIVRHFCSSASAIGSSPSAPPALLTNTAASGTASASSATELAVGDVEAQRPSADLLGQLLAALQPPRRGHDLKARSRQRPRGRFTDPAAGPGYDRARSSSAMCRAYAAIAWAGSARSQAGERSSEASIADISSTTSPSSLTVGVAVVGRRALGDDRELARPRPSVTSGRPATG